MAIGDERLRELFADVLRQALEDVRTDPPPIDSTVAEFACSWVAGRRQLELVSVDDDASRIRLHVLPRIGQLRMRDVRPRHMREVILALRAEGRLAPRTILHVYATVATMFRAAVSEEVIDATPCVLQRGVLPKNVDADPEWRAGAVFGREELEWLISDARIAADRRVLYALKGLAALRHTEAARLRWAQIEARKPLDAILLSQVKSKVPRQVPIHPTLSWILEDWRQRGWAQHYGRRPELDADLVVPTRNLRAHKSPESQRAFGRDLVRLGLRVRRGHDLRRTFVTLARADGARRDVLEAVTHGPRGNIVDVYTSWPWDVLCTEVAKLRISVTFGFPRQPSFFLGAAEPPETADGETALTPMLGLNRR